MKRHIFSIAFALLFLAFAHTTYAQGIFVNLKDGTVIQIPAAELDRVSPSANNNVTVYKADGSSTVYKQSELESITTYDIGQQNFDERITNEIPKEYLSKISAYMPIYSGNTPPSVDGVFRISPTVLLYNSDPNSSHKPGKVYADMINKLTSQNAAQNTVNYQYEEQDKGNVISKSNDVEAKLMGQGSEFTLFSVVETTDNTGVWTKMATIVSGVMATQGIKNIYCGILMLDKGDDTANQKMAIGTFRIFTDQDGLSEPATWQSRMKAAHGIEMGSPNVEMASEMAD